MLSSMASLAPLACIAAWLAKGVMAGAGANVRLCIWLDTQPTTPVNIGWQTCTSASQCMYCKRNQDLSFSTMNRGLSCTHENDFYIESKAGSSGGDTCATDRSLYEVVFSGTYSGQVTTQWVGFNTVKVAPKKNTWKVAICAGPARCESTESSWTSGEKGEIWIVVFPFTPAPPGIFESPGGAMEIEGDAQEALGSLEDL